MTGSMSRLEKVEPEVVVDDVFRSHRHLQRERVGGGCGCVDGCAGN